ncbi:MAG TPA: Uma2 family endonuclease [Chloroflexota bacterium]|nr:Uma2 family endonuclease [Chloroflexota bacterium]
MAIEIRDPAPTRLSVTTYLPNERETQILGGTQAHYAVGENLAKGFRAHATRLGVIWLVRTETDLHYPRADGSTGVFYPDVFVTPGVELHDTLAYQVGAVGKPPMLVVEVLSNTTAKKDLGPKRAAYAELGVLEYVTFDPRPRKRLELHGYRLDSPGVYWEIAPTAEEGIWLASVGLRVVAEPSTHPFRGPLLRLITAAGERLLHIDEETEARRAAEAERDAERWARTSAERARATAERARDAADREIARLRALLKQSGRDPS